MDCECHVDEKRYDTNPNEIKVFLNITFAMYGKKTKIKSSLFNKNYYTHHFLGSV